MHIGTRDIVDCIDSSVIHSRCHNELIRGKTGILGIDIANYTNRRLELRWFGYDKYSKL